MLKIVQILTLRNRFQLINISNVFGSALTPNRFSSTFTVRDFQFENHVANDSGTQRKRFIKYISIENSKHDPLEKNTIKYSDYFPVYDIRVFQDNLKKIPDNELSRLIIFTYVFKTNADFLKFTQVMNALDDECCRRLNNMTIEQLLSIIYSFSYLIPNRLVQLNCYKHAMDRLVNEFTVDKNTSLQFVQICMYLGFWKKDRHSIELMKQFVNRHLDTYLDQMNDIDFAIVSDATYKITVQPNSQLFKERLVQSFLAVDPDDNGLLINCVKSLRNNHVNNEAVTKRMNELITENHLDYIQNFKSLVHLLSYFSNLSLNETKSIERLIKDSMTLIHKHFRADDSMSDEPFWSLPPDDFRIKDFSTFLHNCAQLNTKFISGDDLKFIEQILLDKLNNDEFRYYSDELVSICLALWQLNFRSESLIRHVYLTSDKRQSQYKTERVRINSRRTLLQTCIQIEDPKLMKSLNDSLPDAFVEDRPAPEYQLAKQPELVRVFRLLKNVDNLKSCHRVIQIEQLNIVGLLMQLRNNHTVHVEILEPRTTLSDGSPTALFHLKCRLLKASGCNVIVVNTINTTDEEITKFLNEELGRISVESNGEDHPKKYDKVKVVL